MLRLLKSSADRVRRIVTVCTLLTTCWLASVSSATPPNVLMIAIDDLRPELNCYGDSHIHSPNIDTLAASGRRFARAYCQQAVCNPSRTSLMTGLRPDSIGVTGNHVHFRSKRPGVVTLSQHFMQHGYHALSIGKIYHGVFPDGASKTTWDTMGDPPSWSVPTTRFGPRYYYTEAGIDQAKQSYLAMYRPKSPRPDDWTTKLVFGPMTEDPDVSDETLYDGKVAEDAVATLRDLEGSDKPFFLAVGFIKPHSPFVAPKKYWDLYDAEKIELATSDSLPDDAPAFAGHGSHEIRRYTDQPTRDEIPETNRRRMKHGYYACISYIDAQVGKVLTALREEGLEDNTIVVLFSDHGYHLGEHGLWGKTTNFELDTRVALMIRAPGMELRGDPTQSLAELVDLYPTLADLAGLPIPNHLDGTSLAPLLASPDAAPDDIAISQYPRGGNADTGGKTMGYSLRTDRWRYTEWIDRATGEATARELYDHGNATQLEAKNLAAHERNATVVEELSKRLRSEIRSSKGLPIESVVFERDDTHGYRIPAITRTNAGTLLAFAERRVGLHDHAKNDIVLRRSEDNGKSWQSMQVLADEGGDSLNDPCVVVLDSGRILLRYTRFPEGVHARNSSHTVIAEPGYGGPKNVRLYLMQSDDDGTTWSEPREVTTTFRRESAISVGSPGRGVQLKKGKHAGRVLLPLYEVDNLGDGNRATSNSLVYSDDDGETWTLSVRIDEGGIIGGGNEAQLIEINEGQLLMTSRNHGGNESARKIATSTDGGVTWTSHQLANDLETPACMSSVERIYPPIASQRGWLVHSLPNTPNRRANGTMFISEDEGISWRKSLVVEPDAFAYSCLTRLASGDLGCLYEAEGYKSIVFKSIPLSRLSARPVSVACVGDSITYGAGIADRERLSYPAQMQRLLGDGFYVQNFGLSGSGVLKEAKRSNGWRRCYSTHPQYEDSVAFQPDVVVINLGINDIVHWNEHGKDFVSDYIELIRSYQQLPSKPEVFVWHPLAPLFDGHQFAGDPNLDLLNEAIASAAQQTGVKTIDMFSPLATNREWFPDNIHPNAVGAHKIAKVVAKAIAPNTKLTLPANSEAIANTSFEECARGEFTDLDTAVGSWGAKSGHAEIDGRHQRSGQQCLHLLGGESHSIELDVSVKQPNTAIVFHAERWTKRSPFSFRVEQSSEDGAWTEIYKGDQEVKIGRFSTKVTIPIDATPDRLRFTCTSPAGAGLLIDDLAFVDAQTATTPAKDTDLRLPRVFGNHMVLQAGAELPVWGTAKPNSNVTLQLGNEKQSTTSDANGKWQTRFAAREASAEATTLAIQAGDERRVFEDVVFGEVWVCAGQSNMEWTLDKSSNGKEELSKADHPSIRLLNLLGGARGSSGSYTSQHLERLTPETFCEGQWEIASADTAKNFSAVAWYFGRHLQNELGVPIGLICPAVGGTPAEAWIPREALAENPETKGLVVGNWLKNEQLGEFCRERGMQNLRRAIEAGDAIPSDDLGPNHSFKPGFMWEAGVKPLIPFAIRGTIWYQGESNAESLRRVSQHRQLFPMLVNQWRASWGQDEFPFLFAQLPALNRPDWPVFREQQRRFLGQLDNVGMATTIDTGHPTNVHPTLKKPVGERLATWALGTTYGLKTHAIYTGSLLRQAEPQGNSITVTFDHVGDGLRTSDDQPPRYFELAGNDGVFRQAKAKITGESSVTVSSEMIKQPKYVRYAWLPYPDPPVNLFNSANLPTAPFTTASEESLFAPQEEQIASGANKDNRPNILLIVGEDHGCELSCYGDPVIETPNIDRLASQGMLFESGYVTQSVCSPSRSSIFTGLYPHQNGQLGLATHQFGWFERWPTTYSLLKNAGYRTGLIGKTHVIPPEAVEDYVDFRFQKSSNFSKKKVADYAVQAGEFFRNSDAPFFMTVNYPDAHWPLQGKVEGLPETQVDREKIQIMPYIGGETPRMRQVVQNYYDCMLRLDACVGQLLKQLEDSGKADKTLVVFIGDHGAQMARGKVTVYEGGMRVPYIARWPGVIEPKQRTKALASTIDLLPTFTDAAGVPAPKDLPGKSLRLVFEGTTEDDFREYLACERNCDASHLTFPQRTIRDARFKLIYSPVRDREDPAARYYRIHGASHWSGCLTDEELDGASDQTKAGYARWMNPPEIQLYDLQDDPYEWEDLASDPSRKGTRERLLYAMKQWEVETDDPLRHPEKLKMLMAETDAVNAKKARSPKEGWQYLKYLHSGKKPQLTRAVEASNDDVLFSTSFEGGQVAEFEKRSEGGVLMEATGTVSITSRFARTGKQCLRMLGDEDNSLTFTIPKDMRTLKGISFHAERWTRRDPFSFSIDSRQDGTWQTIAELDQLVVVGARFLSHVAMPIRGEAETEAIRFRVTAASKAGLLIDDLAFLVAAPKQPPAIRPTVVPTEPLELLNSQALFVSGSQDTHTFRIPAIATATNGDLIAACDARRKNSADLVHQRTIDIVFRRSTDNGKTWSPMEVLDTFDDEGCSDPSLLVDEVTGDIFCFYNLMSSDKASREYRFIVQKSADHGKTWGEPVDFTDQVAGPELKDAFKFITSGRGIQKRDGTLVHNYVQVGKGATLFASQDHGATWKTLGDVSPGDESKVVQLHDDSLMVNSRAAPAKRFVHRSADGGKTWKTAEFGLPDPRCNACIIQYTAKQDGYAKDRLLFCNAAFNKGRKNLAVRISYDGGAKWSGGKVLDAGPSAYSEITILKDGSFGVLYEPGYKEVRFARFTLDELTDGKDKLSQPYLPIPARNASK